MTRNLRNLFQRAQCTEQELRTLHGVITAFLGPRKRPKPPGEQDAAHPVPLRRRSAAAEN
jgi:tRNA/rRNA methyltransferase